MFRAAPVAGRLRGGYLPAAMAAARINSANLIAGCFLLGGVGLAVWVSFMLSDRSGLGATTPFTVRFTLSDGTSGLKRGSSVLLGGQPIGRVLTVNVANGVGASGESRPIGIDVGVETRADITLYENAEVNLSLPLLGNLSSINITGIGDPAKVVAKSGASERIEAGEQVTGRVAPPGFLAQAGFGSDQVQQLRSALLSFESSVARVAGLLERTTPQIEATVADVRSMSQRLSTSLPGWTGKLDTTLANVETASGKLDPLLTNVDAAITDARQVLADANAVIKDNRTKIDGIVDSIARASDRVDKLLTDQVTASLKSAGGALDSLSTAVDSARDLLAGSTPTVRNILANANLAAEQLKLTMVEVRSQPWRLLVQPDTKELETQLVYDAARSYAEAATELRAISQSLESLARAGAGQEAIAALTEQLNGSMARFRSAEDAFLNRLIQKRAK